MANSAMVQEVPWLALFEERFSIGTITVSSYPLSERVISHASTPIRVLAAVIERDDRYLICQRPLHKRHGGLWEFPGGKLEADETLLQAARRELEEELGVTALAVQDPLLAIADPGSDFVIEFVPTIITGEPVCLEHADLRWAPLHELPHLPLAPSDQRFVEFLLHRANSDGEPLDVGR